MGLWSTAWHLGSVAVSLPAVAREVGDVLAASGPFRALDVLVERSGGLVPPAVAAEARTLARVAVTSLHVAVGTTVAVIDALERARPVVAQVAVRLDQGIGLAVDAGYWLGSYHSRLAGWLEEDGG